MTQRHLGDPPEDPPEPQLPADSELPERSTPDPVSSRKDAPLGPPRPLAPSDTGLRLRQQAWQKERARFETSKHRSPPEDDSK